MRAPDRNETADERDDRNLMELLQELRVAGLGVQVIFAFLLALPFTNRFTKLGQVQRDLYVASLTLAAVSTALLLAPVAYHRVVFRRHLKRPLIQSANKMALCGLATVALTVCTAVPLVLSAVAAGLATALITTFIVLLFALLWWVIPLMRRLRGEPIPSPGGTPSLEDPSRDDPGDS